MTAVTSVLMPRLPLAPVFASLRSSLALAFGAGAAHFASAHLSMFHPAPHPVGLLLTAYIFFDVIRVRCYRYSGSVGISPHRIGPASPSSLATSLGSAVTASESMVPSMRGFV